MNLEYRLLWFDDQEDNNRGVEDNLRTRLAMQGFTLRVKKISTFKSDLMTRLRELKQEGIWDLILVDWDLGAAVDTDGQKLDGAKLAKKVRKVFPFTDVVFYSAETPKKLRELLFNEDVDGIRCAERGAQLKAATWGVVQSGIRRIVDLNHMRGIVMASVADLDQTLDDCLKALHSKMPEAKRNALVASVVERITEVAESNLGQIQKLVAANFDDLIEHRAFSSALKHLVLVKALKDFADDLALDYSFERLETYDKDVVHPRNAFAHARAVTSGGKTKFAGRDFVIDEEAMASIRRRLIEHKENLADLLTTLGQLEVIGE